MNIYIEQGVIQKIRQLQTQLLDDRVHFFGAKRYRDFIIYKNDAYELEINNATTINKNLNTNPQQAMLSIKNLVNDYHQLPFWKRCWWQITTPMRIYQRIYDIDTLSCIEVAAKQDAAQAQQLYDRSFMKPGWLDIRLNTWRAKLEKMIGTLPQQPHYPPVDKINETSSASRMQVLLNQPNSELCINPNLIAMSIELSKGKNCSITKLVDIYEDLKFDSSTIDKDILHKLEKKIMLVIHPDKNPPSQLEEATKQFQRFRTIQTKIVNKDTLNPDYIALQQLSRDIARYKEQQDKYYNDLMEQFVQREKWIKNQLDQQRSQLEQQQSQLDQQRSQLDQQRSQLDQQRSQLDQLQSQLDQQNLIVDTEIQRLKDGQNRFKNQLDQIFQKIGLDPDDPDTKSMGSDSIDL